MISSAAATGEIARVLLARPVVVLPEPPSEGDACDDEGEDEKDK